jgi:hypothetical protein
MRKTSVMELIPLWAGVIGTWLLFAGPLYQAALELGEEAEAVKDVAGGHDFSGGRSGAKSRDGQRARNRQNRHSAWWWLFPPAKMYFAWREQQRARADAIGSLTPQQSQAMAGFMSKATGWMLVAAGGWAMLLKETTEFIEYYEGQLGAVIVAMVVLTGLAIIALILNVKRVEGLARQGTGKAADGSSKAIDADR